jgi:hypothetical protein
MGSKLLHYQPPNAYPEAFLTKNRKLKPQIITNQFLEASIQKVNIGIINSNLTKNEASIILRSHGLCGEAVTAVIEHANNAKRYVHAKINIAKDPNEHHIVKLDFEQNKEKFMKWKLPSSWFGQTDTQLYVEAPMHLLFLGIMKQIMYKTTEWLIKRKQLTYFQSLTSGILQPIERMNLDWCKPLKYSNTGLFGGWVSENFLGMARLCNWLYSLLIYLVEPEHYNDQDINAKQNIVGTEKIIYMFFTFNKMITLIMSMGTTMKDIDNLEATIRAFLIVYDDCDKGLYDEDDPSFLRHFNVICLLNIPATMRKFGRMRNLWEGGIVGEGFLREMKKQLKQGLIGEWQVWTLKNLLENDIYKEILDHKIIIKKMNYVKKLKKNV